jgi:hypothetical protein
MSDDRGLARSGLRVKASRGKSSLGNRFLAVGQKPKETKDEDKVQLNGLEKSKRQGSWALNTKKDLLPFKINMAHGSCY